MAKLPDPTLPLPPQVSGTLPSAEGMPPPPATPPPPAGESAESSHVKKSIFRFVGPLLIVLLVTALGFIAYTYLIKPRLARPEVVNLTYWGLWEPESVIAPVIEKYQSQHPNVKITYKMQSKVDYRERLQSALARGEGPDIMRIHATWVPMFDEELAAATNEQFSVDEFSQTFYTHAKTDLVKEGAVMAVPLMTDGLGLFVNNEIFSATTSGVPTNWDEFRQTAYGLTQRDKQGEISRAGAALGTTGNVSHWPDILAVLMMQNSVDLAKPNALVDARGRNLGADALRYYTVFATTDRIWDETMPPDVVAFANGKVAMILAPSWQVHRILELNKNLDFSIHPIPQLVTQRRVNWSSYWVETVSKRSTYKKEAWEFLKYLTSQEALMTMYAEANKTREFGEIYPRRDQAVQLENAKHVSAYVKQAETARSWYMSSETGDNGINDEIIAYWADAINAVVRDVETPEDAIDTVARGVEQVLKKYGVQ